MESSTLTQKKLIGAGLTAVVGLVFAGAGCTTPTETPSTVPSVGDQAAVPPTSQGIAVGEPNPSAPAPSSDTAASYKDGTYKAEGSYRSPAGDENIGVSLTLKGGVVTDATVTPEATARMSVRFQGLFVGGFKSQVVGKNIADLHLVGSVSGSSLTPMGFNDALEKIKAQAKA